MLRKFFLMAALAAGATFPAIAAPPSPAGVFDQLQGNVWYLPTADKAARLYVTSMGEGAPIVFLHGGPGNDFNYFVDALAPHTDKYKFILFDQRGSLLSPVPDDKVKDLNLQQLVDDLETLRVATHQDKMVLLGHSFGTFLALSYYIQHPDHVAALILTGSFSPNAKIADTIKAMRPRQTALQNRDASAVLRAAGVPENPANDTPQQASIRWHITKFVSGNIVHLERWQAVQGSEIYYNDKVDDAIGNTLPDALDILPTLKAHPIPIAVIQGDQDYLDPSAANWTAIHAPTVTVNVLPQASHYGWVDAPDEFSADLSAALARATTR